MIPARAYEGAVFVFADDCFHDSAKLFLLPEAMSTRILPTFFRYCGVSHHDVNVEVGEYVEDAVAYAFAA